MNDFDVVGSRGFYRPQAHVTFEQGVELVAVATKHARELGLADLVINVLGLTGFKTPRVFARYALAMKMVESGGAALRIAMVARPELIDFQKIGMLVFQNRGGTGDIFGTETEALAWLDAGRAPRDRLPDVTGGVPPTI